MKTGVTATPPSRLLGTDHSHCNGSTSSHAQLAPRRSILTQQNSIGSPRTLSPQNSIRSRGSSPRSRQPSIHGQVSISSLHSFVQCWGLKYSCHKADEFVFFFYLVVFFLVSPFRTVKLRIKLALFLLTDWSQLRMWQ